MNLSRTCTPPRVWVTFLALLAVGRCLADGFIVVHEAHWLPRPLPPPYSAPRPPLEPRFPFAPLEVTFHQVAARIRDQVAVTTVDQEFFNPNDRQLEGTYLFPIPAGAHLDKFSMEVGGKQVEAELLPADKARQIYEDIVRQARDPALLEYVGRDVFKARIFPLEARGKKRIKLSYTQLLKADAGLVNYLYPLNTEKFSAKPIHTVSLKIELETKRPLKSIYSPSHNVEIRRQGENRAVVGFEAKEVRPDTDFQLLFAPEAAQVGVHLMAYRPGVEDGYFLLLASPGEDVKRDKPMPKDVCFVLDTSGSMAGKKLEQAKKALLFSVENLNDTDRFDVIRFATDTEPIFGQLREATHDHRRRAAEFIQALRPTGGTAIDEALRKALAARPPVSDRPYVIIFLTDGLPTVGVTDTEQIVASASQGSAGHTRVFCFGIGNDVNTHLLDRIAEATRAYSQYVLPEEDLEVKVSSFFARIKEPVLTELKLGFPEGVRVTKLYPVALPDLFKGDQLVLAGRYSGAGAGRLTLEGQAQGTVRKLTFDLAFPATAREHEFIPRLWATRRIGFLLDQIRLHGESAELRDEVAELARQFGIVTPYTAFLIHEDEARRQVPLALRTLPALERDRAAYAVSKEAFKGLQRDVQGPAAVATARYGLAQQSANQVGDALRLGRVEAGRALAATSLPATPAAAGAAGGLPASAVEVSRQVVAYTQQNRFVGGRSFYQHGNQWVEAGAQRLPAAKRVRLQFNSTEYFALAAKRPEARPWLALGQNLVFSLGDTCYEIYE